MENTQTYKVLVIEDHKDMLNVLQKYLLDQSFEVICAETGEKGLELFHSNKPDLVLVDIMLPGISGLEVVQRIKEHTSLNDDAYIPLIVITAKNDIQDIVNGFRNGADDYIIKPFHFEELNARISSAIRIKKLNEKLLIQTNTLENANKKITSLNQNLVQKNKELKQNIYGLHSLFEISMELSSILKYDELIGRTLLTMIGQYSLQSAFYLQADKQNNVLRFFDARGEVQNTFRDIHIDKEDSLISYFRIHPAPVLTGDVKQEINTSPAFHNLENHGVSLMAPVMNQGMIEGLFCFCKRIKTAPYAERELQQVAILTNILSIAIHNARLYQEVEQLSYTDGMTELHNYRYFRMRLNEEIIRNKRTKGGLSLLILDVDYFKNFNDTLGHQAGDRVLQQLGNILKDTVRENDIVARYGGEEFAIILPSVDKKGALILAERIRHNVEQSVFDGEEVQPGGRLTVSMGEASITDDAMSADQLIKHADVALYAAKESGRNKVVAFTPDLMKEEE